MKLVDFSTRRPVTVFIFAVAAVVFGSVAFDDLAFDLLPDITYPSLSVRTEYEGAAPIEIESLITKRIEDAIGVVNNVIKTTSSSRSDLSEVTLEFAWGTNMDFASLDVRERLDMVRLPIEAQKPILCATTLLSILFCASGSSVKTTWCACGWWPRRRSSGLSSGSTEWRR